MNRLGGCLRSARTEVINAQRFGRQGGGAHLGKPSGILDEARERPKPGDDDATWSGEEFGWTGVKTKERPFSQGSQTYC